MRALKISFSIIFFMLLGSINSSGEVTASPLLPTISTATDLTSSAVTLTFAASEPVVSILPDGTTALSIEGFDNIQTPGELDLPFKSQLIAIPGNSTFSLDFNETQGHTLALSRPLARVHETPVFMDGEFVYRIQGQESTTDQPTTTPTTISFEEIGVVRGVRLGRLTYYPLQPLGEGLRFVSQVEVTVNFSSYVSQDMSETAHDPLLDTVRSQVVNPEHVQPAAKTTQPNFLQPDQPTATNRVAIIEITQAGITEITYEALNSSGFPVSTVNPHNLILKQGASEVHVLWEGDGNSSFEAGERLLFYAEPRFSRWANYDNYFLEEGNASGLRMTSRSASPGASTAGDAIVSSFFEQNKFYFTNTDIPAGHDGEKWAWDFLQQPNRTLRSFSAAITAADLNKTAEFTVWLTGITDPSAALDHRVNIAINSTSLGAVEWNGYQALSTKFPIQAGDLINGINNLELSLPGIDGVLVEANYLDAFEISYVLGSDVIGENVKFFGETPQRKYTANLQSSNGIRAFDITNSSEPIALTNLIVSSSSVTIGDPAGNSAHTYYATSENGIIAPNRVRLKGELSIQAYGFDGGDYLIITHEDFAGGLGDLVDLRTSLGHDVTIENAQAIYDNYSEGIPSPHGIKSYISSAYAFWPTKPIYLLLVGDGNYDPKRYLASTISDTYIPPYLGDVDPWIGETSSDNWYVSVDGADNLPDLIIGRFPVTTIQELQAVIAKTIAYENGVGGTDWRADSVFIADNTDSGGNFIEDADYVINNVLTPEINVEEIYHSTSVTETQNAITVSLNLGKGFVNYFGHSSTHQWAFEGFLHKDDTVSFTNTNRLSVFVQMTCLTGKFQEAGGTVLDEALLLLPDTGAVAVWGPSGFGLATGHQHLSEGFYNSLLIDKNPSIGAAALAGKLFLIEQSVSFMDLVDTFTFLGDPALNYYPQGIDNGHGVYLPIISK